MAASSSVIGEKTSHVLAPEKVSTRNPALGLNGCTRVSVDAAGMVRLTMSLREMSYVPCAGSVIVTCVRFVTVAAIPSVEMAPAVDRTNISLSVMTLGGVAKMLYFRATVKDTPLRRTSASVSGRCRLNAGPDHVANTLASRALSTRMLTGWIAVRSVARLSNPFTSSDVTGTLESVKPFIAGNVTLTSRRDTLNSGRIPLFRKYSKPYFWIGRDGDSVGFVAASIQRLLLTIQLSPRIARTTVAVPSHTSSAYMTPSALSKRAVTKGSAPSMFSVMSDSNPRSLVVGTSRVRMISFGNANCSRSDSPKRRLNVSFRAIVTMIVRDGAVLPSA
mmetsp:Transcript_10683/g.33146  ORF Transcript_10683/g.33146 Transcript_10683/m.33146 type:complete len:333 (+) Transcript_10683:2069-3067(+)